LFKQVVAEYTGQPVDASGHPALPSDGSGKGKAARSGKGDPEKEGETRLSV
jgi:LysR family transcriptional regulator of virulence genes